MSIRRRMMPILETGYPVGTTRQWADGERTKQGDGTWVSPEDAAKAAQETDPDDEDEDEEDEPVTAKKGKQKPSHEKRVAQFEAWKGEGLKVVQDAMSSLEPLATAAKEFKKKFGKIEGLATKAERVGGRIYEDAENEANDLWDGDEDPPEDVEARKQEIMDRAECMSDALNNVSSSSDIEESLEILMDQVAELKKKLKSYGKDLEDMDPNGCG